MFRFQLNIFYIQDLSVSVLQNYTQVLGILVPACQDSIDVFGIYYINFRTTEWQNKSYFGNGIYTLFL